MLATAGLGEESVEAEIRQKIDTTSKFNHFKKFNSTSRKHLHFLFLILQINFGAILLHLPSHLSLGMFNNNIPIIWSHIAWHYCPITIIFVRFIISSVYLSSPSPMESSLGICPSGWIPCSRQ